MTWHIHLGGRSLLLVLYRGHKPMQTLLSVSSKNIPALLVHKYSIIMLYFCPDDAWLCDCCTFSFSSVPFICFNPKIILDGAELQSWSGLKPPDLSG